MGKITCPKCKVELNEVLSVDESIMEYEACDEGYIPGEPTVMITKCSRCGTVLEEQMEEKWAKITCPKCRVKLDKAIGVVETLMEYDGNEESYLRVKEISLPTITRCLNCGADLRGTCTPAVGRDSKE